MSMYEVEHLIQAAREAVRGTTYKGTAEGFLKKAANIVRAQSHLTDSEKDDMISRIRDVADSLDCDI